MQKRLIDLYPLIQEICKKISGDEDLAHDVLLRLNKFKGLDGIPDYAVKSFIRKTAKHTFINNNKRERYCQLKSDIKQTEEAPSVEPYEYIKRIRESELTEVEQLWVFTYLDYGSALEPNKGVYTEISKGIKVTRQTVKKYIKNACKKLKK